MIPFLNQIWLVKLCYLCLFEMGNKNSGEHRRLSEGVEGAGKDNTLSLMQKERQDVLLERRVSKAKETGKAERYKSSQGHIDLLFEMLSPHVPDEVINVIFLFELSLPRKEHANEIKIKEHKDIYSLSKEQLSSLQFGDEVILLSLKSSRQWIYTYSQEKRQFVLEDYPIRGLPFEYTKYVVSDPLKRKYWQYGFLIHPGISKKEER